MAIIYETSNFIVKSARKPHVYVDRRDGGHIMIKMKPEVAVRDRTLLVPEVAVEYMKLSMVVGEAMKIGLGGRGIDIGIINYQEMGNWSVFKSEGPKMHLHLFGRATDAVVQEYGQGVKLPPLESGFYDDFQPLDEEDEWEVLAEIERLMATAKYRGVWSEGSR